MSDILIFGSVVDMQSFLTDCCQSLENEDKNNYSGEIKIIKVCVCVRACMCVCVKCGHSLTNVFEMKILEWTDKSTSQ